MWAQEQRPVTEFSNRMEMAPRPLGGIRGRSQFLKFWKVRHRIKLGGGVKSIRPKGLRGFGSRFFQDIFDKKYWFRTDFNNIVWFEIEMWRIYCKCNSKGFFFERGIVGCGNWSNVYLPNNPFAFCCPRSKRAMRWVHGQKWAFTP